MHFPESLYLLCPIMVRAVQGLFQPKYRVGQKLTNGENCKIFAPYLEPQFWVASAPISNISWPSSDVMLSHIGTTYLSPFSLRR